MKDTVPVEPSGAPTRAGSIDQILIDQTTRWFPYPQQAPEVTLAFNDLQHAYYSLHRIGYDIQHMLFGGKTAPQEHNVSLLDDKLQRWHQMLPETLDVGDDSTLIKPPVMDLQYVNENMDM